MPDRLAWADVTADPDLVMYRASYAGTFRASCLGAVYVFAGLWVLGLGERGSAGHGLPVLLFRVLAWSLLKLIPFQAMAVMNARSLAMYGLQPSWSAPLGFSPGALKSHARERDLPTWKWVIVPYLFHLFCFVMFATLIVLPVGPPRQHLGLAWIFSVGHAMVIIVSDKCIPRWLPPLERTWGVQSGIYTCGAALVGFIFVIVSYVWARGAFTTKWLGIAMAPLVSAYEFGTVFLIGNAFKRYFVMSPKAREAYRGTQQSICVCMIVGITHNCAESARLILIIFDAHASGEIGTVLVSIVTGVVINLATRSGWMQKAVAWLLPGRMSQTNMGLLLQDMKFPIGYVRFLAAMAIVAARKALGNLAFARATLGWALLACIGAEVIEDVLVLLLARLGLHAEPVFKPLTWEQALERAKRCRVHPCQQFFLGSSPGLAPRASGFESTATGREIHVLPGSAPSSTEDETGGTGLRDERLLAGLLLEAHQFSTKVLPSESSPVLPGWAHFTIVYVGMFIEVLTAIFVLGGVDFVLGFSDALTEGTSARAVLWWPVMDPNP